MAWREPDNTDEGTDDDAYYPSDDAGGDTRAFEKVPDKGGPAPAMRPPSPPTMPPRMTELLLEGAAVCRVVRPMLRPAGIADPESPGLECGSANGGGDRWARSQLPD